MPVVAPKLYLDKKRYHGQLFAVLGIVGFVANLLILLAGRDHLDQYHKLAAQVAIGAWILLPPLWFFYEFFYYFPANGNPAAGFERLKSVQDVSSKVWAAVAVLLAGIYSATFP